MKHRPTAFLALVALAVVMFGGLDSARGGSSRYGIVNHQATNSHGDAAAEQKPSTRTTVRGLTDRATLTSTCGVGEDGGSFCSETDERFLGRLPVRGRALVRVDTYPAPGRVKAYLVRLKRNGDIAEWRDWSVLARKVEGSHGRTWSFRLPRRLGDANAIHLFLHYPDGASYPGGDTVSQATYTSLIVHD